MVTVQSQACVKLKQLQVDCNVAVIDSNRITLTSSLTITVTKYLSCAGALVRTAAYCTIPAGLRMTSAWLTLVSHSFSPVRMYPLYTLNMVDTI